MDYIGVDEQGRFDMEQFKRVLDDDTALVSVMWANSETGTIFPIQEIAKLTHEHGALFHTDAVQAAGKIPGAVPAVGAVILCMSGQKLNDTKRIENL